MTRHASAGAALASTRDETSSARDDTLHDLVLGSSRDVRPGGGDKIEPSAARRGDPGSVGLRRRRGFARFPPPERSRRRAHVHLERCPPGDAQAPRPLRRPRALRGFPRLGHPPRQALRVLPGLRASLRGISAPRDRVARERAPHRGAQPRQRLAHAQGTHALRRPHRRGVHQQSRHLFLPDGPRRPIANARDAASRPPSPTSPPRPNTEHRTPNTVHATTTTTTETRSNRRPSARRNRHPPRTTPRAPVSLKEAANVAAARGESLPSDANAGSILGRVFPALGASGGLTRDERERRARERRANRRRRRREVERHIADGLHLGGPLGTGFPKRHDWAEVYDFGDIVHQGTCAGCWAYSTAAVVEAANAIANGAHRRLSPYALIDCDNLDHGCATGNMASAYAWIQTSRHGIPPLERYPSRAAMGCDRASLGKAPGGTFEPRGTATCPCCRGIPSGSSSRRCGSSPWRSG